MSSLYYDGKRLSFDGQLCTTRYYGEVKGTIGDWLGVEWDDPTRGKHSGEHAGIKYFECLSKHPTAGSFVRPTRKPDPPRSFVDALKAKYASEDFEDPDVHIVFTTQEKKRDIPVQQARPIRFSGKEAEEVGFDKIRKQLANLQELRIVILDGLCMSRPSATLKARQSLTKEDAWPMNLTDIKDTSPKVIELDLSRNLFEEWREIASICAQLDRLRSLRVDGNRFRDISLTPPERQWCLDAFSNIKTLKLENTLLSWEDLTSITTFFPTLTTLVASSNDYTALTPHYLAHTITDLSLEGNNFHSISDLQPLTSLTSLRRLILKSNDISEILSTGTPPLVFSETVVEVDLSYNELSTWSFIDALVHVFPGLTSLRISHNPLFAALQSPDGRALSAEDGYMLTIARLGNLKTLNFSPISEKERLNAETYYLSLIAKELSFSPETKRDEIIKSHPRYDELCEEYGEPVVKREEGNINPNSLAARLIRFSFRLADKSGEEFETEVPLSFTAYTLLGIVGKHFGIPPMKCRLIWETGDWRPAPRTDGRIEDGWDSESSDEEEGLVEKGGLGMIMREVEILPGTKSLGTWIDGMEAVVRVERQT